MFSCVILAAHTFLISFINLLHISYLHQYIYVYFFQDTALDKAKLPVPEPSDAERASLVNFDDIANDLKKLYTQIKSQYFVFSLDWLMLENVYKFCMYM